jgi:hypothetical protein
MMAEPLPAPSEGTTAGDLLGRCGTTWLGLYLIVLPVVLFWFLVAIFPRATPTDIQTRSLPGAQGSTTAGQSGTPTVKQETTTTPFPKFDRVPILKFPFTVMVGPFTDDQGFILLALLAGALGSYLHVAQSFANFVGHRTAERSWVWWYMLRAPIGAALGVLFYFVIRAGLTSGATEVSAYGVVAFGALAGLFSKQATNKLAEVFDTLFRTADKATPAAPTITSVTPSPVPRGTTPVTLTVVGTGFVQGAKVHMGDTTLATEFKSPTQLTATIPVASLPASPPTDVNLVVVNPAPAAATSPAFKLHFD